MIDAAQSWDGLDSQSLARRLGVPSVELRLEVESTQDIAHRLAEQGAPPGTLVLADAQRAGRGRHGRSWSSQPGRGVWCTLIERPTEARAIDVLSIRVGLFAAEALDAFTTARVHLKWPNDLIVNGRKLGGILAEARWSGSSLAWIAVGVGVNVVAPHPADVAGAAALAPGVERVNVLSAIVSAVRSASAASGWLTPAELDRYRARDALARRMIVSPGAGTVVGITAAGALVVETPNGSEEYRTGTIRYLDEENA